MENNEENIYRKKHGVFDINDDENGNKIYTVIEYYAREIKGSATHCDYNLLGLAKLIRDGEIVNEVKVVGISGGVGIIENSTYYINDEQKLCKKPINEFND